jgi:predicted dehydrogenase
MLQGPFHCLSGAVLLCCGGPTDKVNMKRRTFLNSLSSAAAPMVVSASALGQAGRPAASDRVTMGVIGTGNQGIGDMRGFLRDPRVQVVAVCDVNRMSPGYWGGDIGGREPARSFVEWHYAREKRSGKFKGCDMYEDFRDLLARKDIDAVLIALPDHWHAIPVIMAAKAGKDIYGEKPLSLTVAAGRAMSNAVRDNHRIFQTGSQQRSDARFRKACELVRNGRIGKLHTVTCGLPGGTPDLSGDADRRDPEPVPDGFNYQMWLGPAPDVPYSPARCFVNFRWILDYSGGQITDWGGHHPDIAQWGMGTELTGPVEIRNAAGKWSDDGLYNTATEFTFEAIYDNGVRLVISNRTRGGVTFEGSDGSVWANRGAIQSKPEDLVYADITDREKHLYKSDDHFRNFIDCVLSRAEPVAPIEQAHRTITIAHLGNIALKLGRNLKWDPVAERVVNDEEANRMLSRPMRDPWSLSM